MSIPKETLWELEPHTAAKHEILRKYLGAWFGIMGKYNERIIFIDGFCGPGRYQKGEEGSPLIAFKSALGHHEKQKVNKVTFVFIEADKDRHDFLKNELQKFRIPSDFSLIVEHNQFENTIRDIFNGLDTRGVNIAPTFAFIDPFGFSGVPFSLVEKLLSNPKTEVFINVMAGSISRFANYEDANISGHIVALFGTEEVLKVQKGKDRISELRSLYLYQLSRIAQFVRYFEMRDDSNKIIYYLFFATNNRVGHAKMKEAFWGVDNENGFRFSDATDPTQLVLFENDPSIKLADVLSGKFKGKKKLVEQIRLFVEDETPFTTSQMKKALKHIEENKGFSTNPVKNSGVKRIKHTFPDDVVVSFIG